LVVEKLKKRNIVVDLSRFLQAEQTRREGLAVGQSGGGIIYRETAL
jgi:hypothetical protein